jgi:DHA1 family inner membrane transport protein
MSLPALGFAVFALWGVFNPLFLGPQQARLVDLHPEASGVLLPLNTTSVYLGISLGSLLGSALLPATGATTLSAFALLPLAAAAATHWASSPPRRDCPGTADAHTSDRANR